MIIPTYNRPEEVHNCIASVLKQTVRPDELILVDDGQLDGLPLEAECRRRGIHWNAFAYALLGYFIIRALILVLSPSKDNTLHLVGILEGTKEILWNKVDP